MTKTKTTSVALTKAQLRIAGIKSINENLDCGNGFSVSLYQSTIAAAQNSLEVYNQALQAMNAAKQAMVETDKNLAQINERALLSIASKYGKNSIEYKKSGGVPPSERKRSVPRVRKPAPPTSMTLAAQLPSTNGKVAQLALN
jgi:hypothetical protein